MSNEPRAVLEAARKLLPKFEVGQVVGELQAGRRPHDWCSIHGDIGPAESIDAHARRAHGASSEAIRKARKTLKAVARVATDVIR